MFPLLYHYDYFPPHLAGCRYHVTWPTLFFSTINSTAKQNITQNAARRHWRMLSTSCFDTSHENNADTVPALHALPRQPLDSYCIL